MSGKFEWPSGFNAEINRLAHEQKEAAPVAPVVVSVEETKVCMKRDPETNNACGLATGHEGRHKPIGEDTVAVPSLIQEMLTHASNLTEKATVMHLWSLTLSAHPSPLPVGETEPCKFCQYRGYGKCDRGTKCSNRAKETYTDWCDSVEAQALFTGVDYHTSQLMNLAAFASWKASRGEK